MRFKHSVKSEFISSFRTQKVAGMFDVSPEEKLTKEWDVDFPIEGKEWEIGLIVGASGAGKTTMAKHIFGEENYHTGFEWSYDKSLLDDFSKSLKANDITSALSHVGFSSPPAWMLPFNRLSNGQQFRAEMARLILEHESDDPVVVDEFTSVVDRTVAKASSEAIQKYVRRNNKKFVAVSCHFDIVDWLRPDWILTITPEKCTFEYTRGSLRRPEININIQRVHHSAWDLFKGHHYLDKSVHKAAHCYVATWNEEPVGFGATLKFPHPHVKNMWRGHRTVVLPDFQGLGLGNMLSESIGEIYLEKGQRYASVTSHPAMVSHRQRSKKWVMTRFGDAPKKGKNAKLTGQSTGRLTASFEYIGDKND